MSLKRTTQGRVEAYRHCVIRLPLSIVPTTQGSLFRLTDLYPDYFPSVYLISLIRQLHIHLVGSCDWQSCKQILNLDGEATLV